MIVCLEEVSRTWWQTLDLTTRWKIGETVFTIDSSRRFCIDKVQITIKNANEKQTCVVPMYNNFSTKETLDNSHLWLGSIRKNMAIFWWANLERSHYLDCFDISPSLILSCWRLELIQLGCCLSTYSNFLRYSIVLFRWIISNLL